MTNTICLPGSDAAVIRIKDTKKGIAISTDCNSRYCYLDPYSGAGLAMAEAARNISCSGAEPIAITDCLNFGNPEKPETMWQFKQSVAGISDACIKLGTPVTGGNVSFYNETRGEGIYPTPTIGMVGIIDDINFHCTQWWKDEGDVIILIGNDEPVLGGTEYLKQIHNKVLGMPPLLDFDREIAVQRACRTGIARKIIKQAHDVSDGGIAVALAECSVTRPRNLIGAAIIIDDRLRPDVFLFGESASRIIISVDPKDADTMLAIARGIGAPAKIIGRVGGNKLTINNILSVDVLNLHAKWSEALSKMLGEK